MSRVGQRFRKLTLSEIGLNKSQAFVVKCSCFLLPTAPSNLISYEKLVFSLWGKCVNPLTPRTQVKCHCFQEKRKKICLSLGEEQNIGMFCTLLAKAIWKQKYSAVDTEQRSNLWAQYLVNKWMPTYTRVVLKILSHAASTRENCNLAAAVKLDSVLFHFALLPRRKKKPMNG